MLHVVIVYLFKLLELSGLFDCLGGLVKIFIAWGRKETAGLWFPAEGSVPRLTLWIRKLGKHNIEGITIVEPPPPLLKVGG